MYKKHSRLYHVLDYALRPHHFLKNILWRRRAYVSKEDFIFVVGAPRSGTTMMQKLLAGVRGVKSFQGETEVFSKKNIFNYSRFSHILSGDEYDRVIRDAHSDAEFLERIHVAILGDGLFLEKTPQHAKAMARIAACFPKAKVVCMVRDPRASYLSAVNGRNIPQAKSVEAYAKYWNQCNQKVLENANGNVIFVRYEDFVSDPKVQFRRLCHSLELEYDEALLEMKSDDARAQKKEFSNIVRPVNSDSVSSWEIALEKDVKDAIVKICQKGMVEHGYF